MLKKLMTLGVIFVFAQSAFAQQGTIGKKLTLQDCIGIALKRNTSVLQAHYSAESQAANLLSAYGGLLPSFSGTGEFDYTRRVTPVGYQIYQGVPIPTSGGLAFSRQYQLGVGGSYTLFNGFANYNSIAQAKSSSQSADLDYTRSKQTAVYQTTVDYLAVFNARDQLNIMADNLKRDKQQLETIKEENSVGSASLADVYQQQATVSADEYSMIQAKNAFDQAAAALKYYLGIPVTDSVDFSDPSIVTEIDTTQFAELNSKYRHIADLVGSALDTRPDYQASVQKLDASKSQLAVANAGYSPTLTLRGAYQILGPRIPDVNQNRSFYASLYLSVPIFNGFQTQTNIQQADVAVKSARQTVDATRRQVQLDIYRALLNLNASEKQYEAGVNQVAAAKINLETEREKYSIGSATLLDVLTANAQYTQALSNRVVAAYNYIQAKQQIDYAIGKIKY